MTTIDFRGGKFDAGRVVQLTFKSISQNWLVFLVSSIVLAGIPNVISGFGYGQNPFTTGSPGMLAAIALGSILALIGAYVLQGLVVFVTINGFNGKKVGLSEAFGAGLRFFFPLLGLGILMGLGLMLGFVLLIIPGIILSVMWVVAAPALVAEKRGIIESFQRSRDLTRGSRWIIFVLALAYLVVIWVVSFTVAGIGMAGVGATGATSSAGFITAFIITPFFNVLAAVLSSAGVAAIYYELRTAKEGAAPDQLAAAFD